MRLLFLADAVFKDKPGGSRVVARELAAGLTRKGHEVTFLVARHNESAPDIEVEDGIRTIRYDGAGKGASFIREGYKVCSKLWNQEQFDVVHTHFAYAAYGPMLAIPSHFPHVRTFHGPWHEEGWVEDIASSPNSAAKQLRAYLKRTIRYQIEKSNIYKAYKLTVLSDFFRNRLKEQFHVSDNRISLIAGGADIERFHPSDDKREIRKKLQLPADSNLIFTVRRLAPRMGLDNLIDAMPAIVQAIPNIHLVIGGKGPEKPNLEKKIKQLGLDRHVVLAGFIEDNDLPLYYQSSDLFVLPTVALEGFGLVTVEALASGVPVIGTPVGATLEILGPLDHRLITKNSSPESLAESIIAFFQNSWRFELPGDCLHNFVKNNYTWDKHVDLTEAVYEEAMEAVKNGDKK